MFSLCKKETFGMALLSQLWEMLNKYAEAVRSSCRAIFHN